MVWRFFYGLYSVSVETTFQYKGTKLKTHGEVLLNSIWVFKVHIVRQKFVVSVFEIRVPNFKAARDMLLKRQVWLRTEESSD